MMDALPMTCPTCGDPRSVADAYCPPCKSAYMAKYRRDNKHVPTKPKALAPTREFPGVDIDRIHYKLGAVKIKEAA